MNCIAHRGFCGVNPENTIPAVEDAVRRADAVEVDVRTCGSGELVVCHDETVDRTTDGNGDVSAHTATELAALSVEGSEAGVPTFEAVVDVIPDGVTLHAELKERGTAKAVEAVVTEAGCETVVSAFLPEAVAAVEAVPTALAVSAAGGAVEQATELGCSMLHPRLDACTSSLVERAHDAGLAVNGWTVVDPEQAANLRNVGVDGAITDFPECCPSVI